MSLMLWKYEQNNQNLKKVYQSWGNQYLERSRHKRRIQDLQLDITDGVLLADIIEAVTGERVRNIKTKPKNDDQMLENLETCLNCIEDLGVNIEGLRAPDLKEGNLRAILGLFFSLSRYKQQKKSCLLSASTQSEQPAVCTTPPSRTSSSCGLDTRLTMLSKLPSPFKPANSNRNSVGIVSPPATTTSNGSNRRSLNTAQKAVSNGTTSGIPAPRFAQTSRPVSPGSSASPHSLIPVPSSRIPACNSDQKDRHSRSSSTASSKLSSPGTKFSQNGSSGLIPPTSGLPAQDTTNLAMGKTSMFGFGFFQKTKQEKVVKNALSSSPPKPSNERNSTGSSSSGFSSAKSDTSASGSDTILTSPTCTPENPKALQPAKETRYENAAAAVTNSPKMVMRALAKKTFSKSSKEPPRLLSVEPKAEDPPVPVALESKLPAPSRSSEANKRASRPLSGIPRSTGQSMLPKPGEAFASPDEQPSPSPASLPLKSELMSSASSSADRTPKKLAPSAAKVSGALPAPSSGIPKPAAMTPKIPASQDSKPEKRLSFPASQTSGVPVTKSSGLKSPMGCSITDRNSNDNPEVISSSSMKSNEDQSSVEHRGLSKTSAEDEYKVRLPEVITEKPDGERFLNGTLGKEVSVDEEDPVWKPNASGGSASEKVPRDGSPVASSVALLDEKEDSGTRGSNEEAVATSSESLVRQHSQVAVSDSRAIREGKQPMNSSPARTDISAGYLSDGDILISSHSSQLRIFADHTTNGYISEGGGDFVRNGSNRKLKDRQREAMPLIKEPSPVQMPRSSGQPRSPRKRVDIEESLSEVGPYGDSNADAGRQVSHPQPAKTPNGPLHQHSGLSGGVIPNSENGDSNGHHSVASMPLLRVSRTEEMRRPKPAPISPPPRDPETALSSSPRNPTPNGFGNYSEISMRRITDIYASPVRKRTPAKQSEAYSEPEFAGRNGLGKESFSMTTTNNHANGKSNDMMSVMSNGRERNKISGSTQTSPQEQQQSKQPVTNGPNNHYSTNSLSRGMSRHAITSANGANGQELPRCRSVVQGQMEMTLAPSQPHLFASSTAFDGLLAASRSCSNPTSRFSVPTRPQEYSVMDMDPRRYDMTNEPVSSLPPKSNRLLRQTNGHLEASQAEMYNRSSGAHQGIYSRPGVEAHFRDSGFSTTSSMWDYPHRGGAGGSSSQPSSARGYPLTYSSMNTHGMNHFDELDNSSTASFPLQSLNRSSAPGSPLLSYSLPRHTQSNNGSNVRNTPSLSPYVGSLLSKIHSRDDEMNGSLASLVSAASSVPTSSEDRQAREVRKLRRELERLHDQLAHMALQKAPQVTAFENVLNSISERLIALDANSLRKDGELSEIRRTVDALRQRGSEAGLVSQEKMNALTSPNLARRHTFNSAKDAIGENTEKAPRALSRQMSTDSVASLNSLASNDSTQLDDEGKKKKKKSWLRSSFSKAFSRGRPKPKNGASSISDAEDGRSLDFSTSVPNSPLLQASRMTVHASRHPPSALQTNVNGSVKPASSFSALDRMDERDETSMVDDLQKQLREKEMALNDFRLDALNSAQQMDQYKESLAQMKSEIEGLRQDNLRLQRLIAVKRRSASSERKSPRDGGARSTPSESGIGDESPTFDARQVPVRVVMMENGAQDETSPEDVLIGAVKIGSATQWDHLDRDVRKVFEDYVSRISGHRKHLGMEISTSNQHTVDLGLNAESIACYNLGNTLRSGTKSTNTEPNLPIDCVRGDDEKIRIIVKGSREQSLELLAFQSLIPRFLLERYICLISDHKRVILCGPSGTGKSFLALKMAEHLVLRSGKSTVEGSIIVINVEQNSSGTLRQYLKDITEQCENKDADVPLVVIIDNLHHIPSLGEVFNGFLSVKHHRCPFIIGTMNQSVPSPSKIQLHHNFRWIMCANHTEPLRGFLARYLKRKLVEHENTVNLKDSALTSIVDWVPQAWSHVNSFLEKHGSADLTIGPAEFLQCPMNVRESQQWFTNLWNYSLVPYILEAVKKGLQLYGRCEITWEDPADWIIHTYPWPGTGSSQIDVEVYSLLRLRPEDVGFDTYGLNLLSPKSTTSTSLGDRSDGGSFDTTMQPDSVIGTFGVDSENDPLSDMVKRLQEVARYSNNEQKSTEQSVLKPQDH